MKITVCSGRTCLGDLRLTPLDVGYDLRTIGTAINLPAEFGSVGLERDGEIILIEGTRAEMIAEIRDAGYKIANG